MTDLQSMVVALEFKELASNAAQLRRREVMPPVDPILKHGGGTALWVFEPQYLGLKALISLLRKFAD